MFYKQILHTGDLQPPLVWLAFFLFSVYVWGFCSCCCFLFGCFFLFQTPGQSRNGLNKSASPSCSIFHWLRLLIPGWTFGHKTEAHLSFADWPFLALNLVSSNTFQTVNSRNIYKKRTPEKETSFYSLPLKLESFQMNLL